MRLRSYFVHTMEEALQVAKVELGDDAMLVDSKRLETPPGGRSRLEVIFAAPITPPPPKAVAPPVPKPVSAVPGLLRFRHELTDLLDSLNRDPDPTRMDMLTPALPQLEALRSRLRQSEVPPPVAVEVLERCRPIYEGLFLKNTKESKEVEKPVLSLLTAEWPHTLSSCESNPARVLAFVGPAGAGKTSAIAKLAFRLGVSTGRPLSVLSVDNVRIGASDQLAHICSLMSVPFHSLESSGALCAAVTAGSQRGIVLVDTPGFGAPHADLIEETASDMRRIASLETHLVLPATMRYSELQRQQRRFAPFSPERLLFTRLDETDFFGPSWAFVRNCRLPVSWVSTGPGVPEDLEEADAMRFTAAVLGIASEPPPAEPAKSSPILVSAAKAGASRI